MTTLAQKLLVKLAKHYKTYKSFEMAYSAHAIRPIMWHITEDPNFQIKTDWRPSDVASGFSGTKVKSGEGGIMVSSLPEQWRKKGTLSGDRQWVAAIDITDLIPDKEWTNVARGFGHEVFIHRPEKAKLLKVYPLKSGVSISQRIWRELPRSPDELEKVYDMAHSDEKEQLKEYISYLIQEQLEEDKFEDAVKANPEFTLYLKNYFQGIKPKYLPWILKMIKYISSSTRWTEDIPEKLENLRKLLDDFEKLALQNKIKEKDINKYDWATLKATVEKANTPTETELRKIAKSNSKKIYEDENFLIIEPLNKEASIYYGKGTKWCISAIRDNKFEDYFTTKTGTTEEDVLAGVWFLFNKKENTKYAITFSDPGAPMMGSTTIYNSEDDHVRTSFIADMLPQNIIDLINQKAGFTFLERGAEDI